MAAIGSACELGRIDAVVQIVISPSESCPAIERAQSLGYPTVVVPYGDDYPERLLKELLVADIVCLAGYVKPVPGCILDAFPNRILNIHPSLLPKFGGRGMYGMHVHRAVLGLGETETGCTVHVVSEGYDEGRILVQKRCEVKPDDTPEALAERVLELEHLAYPEAIAQVIRGISA